MQIKPIRTDTDYQKTLCELEQLFTVAKPSPLEKDKAEVLTILIQDFEAKRIQKKFPDAVEAIKFTMAFKGLSPKDLVPMIGKRNRVYEILNYKRPLTLKMIWNLHTQLGIPAETLIKPQKTRTHA